MLNLAIHRLHTHQLENTKLKTPAEVVERLGAVQAQDYAGAKWSLGLRLPASTDSDIEKAIHEKAFLRTWVMRGTLHFVPLHDIHWMVSLLAPRLISISARRYQQLELDYQTLTRSNDLLANALRDGDMMSRPDLLEHLEQNGISTAGQRGVHMLQRASLDGLICQGEAIKNVPMFMLMPPKTGTLTREESLAELARRFFTGHGPATLQDFVWWSGMSVGEARAGLNDAKSQLIEEKIGKQSYWFSEPAPTTHHPSFHLLPGFDEYLMYKDRSASIEDHIQKIRNGKNGMLTPTIVTDGWVIAFWKRTFKKDTVIIHVEPFRPFTETENQSLEAAAQRFGDFLGMKAVIEKN